VLRKIWNRIVGRSTAAADAREADRERRAPAERPFIEESIEDIQADEFVGEHLGQHQPGRLSGEDEPPRV
jgi:hypothetical protein